MSNRTMLEFNHDYCPHTEKQKEEFLQGLLFYLGSGDPEDLPKGVTWFGMRHHSSECPMGAPPRGWSNRDRER